MFLTNIFMGKIIGSGFLYRYNSLTITLYIKSLKQLLFNKYMDIGIHTIIKPI